MALAHPGQLKQMEFIEGNAGNAEYPWVVERMGE
jgi:hypothetical protein